MVEGRKVFVTKGTGPDQKHATSTTTCDGWLQDQSHDVTRKSGLVFVTRPGATAVRFEDGDDSRFVNDISGGGGTPVMGNSCSGWNAATGGGSASADGSEGAMGWDGGR